MPNRNTQALYAPTFVRNLFNRMAASYDRVSFITSFGFSNRWRRQFLRNMPAADDGTRILDLMTGRGELLPFLCKHYHPTQITALDFAAGMLKHVEELNGSRYNAGITVINGDALAMPFADNSFDGIVCGFGLKTLDDAQTLQLATEIHRVLKPNGFARFIEISVPPTRILRVPYRFHLAGIVPFAGWFLLGNPETYQLLWRYTRLFQCADKAAESFRMQGFSVKPATYFYGCATGFEARKACKM